ncbi:MAG: site-specific integrase [Sphaerochaetaceae bacterium]
MKQIDKPYRLRKPKQLGKYQVCFRHMPGKWMSTGTDDITQAVFWAESKLKEDGIISNKDVTLKAFAEKIFTPEDPCRIRDRDKRYGREYQDDYYYKKQKLVDNYIIPRFGRNLIKTITDVAIEDWFLDLKLLKGKDMSDDTKNKVLIAFRLVMQEAVRKGHCKENAAAKVKLISCDDEEREPFNPDEMHLLFPSDDEEILKVWGGLFWATYFLIFRDTGFRPSEIAALRIQDYYPEQHGVYSMKSVNYHAKRIQDSIKTTKKGKKYKVGVLTSQTERFLQQMIEDCRERNQECLFLMQGKNLLCTETSNKHFKSCADRIEGLERRDRTQYCLRHSFETDLAGRVENKIVAELMAHTKFNPVYDHRSPQTLLQQLQPVRDIIEKR